MKTGPKPLPPEERFWKKVNKRSKDECWEWNASTFQDGYGQFYINPERRAVAAHIFSYEIHFGERKNLFVCHKCDNKKCINPNHLFLGTALDNMQDMIKKGRKVNKEQRGSKNAGAKLTEKDVLNIRKSHRKIKNNVLAKIFNVHISTIEYIIARKTWKHI